jgi:EthD domain
MKVLLTLGFEGDREKFVDDTLRQLRTFVADGGAERTALDVKAAGDELETVKILDSDPVVTAMVSLWEPASVARALDLPWPAGAHRVGAYEVDEVVQRDYERTWPAGDVSPGLKCVCLVRRKPGTTHEAYSEHWRRRHGPLAVRLQPGFWHYVQNHITDYLADTPDDIDGIGELHFRSADGVLSGMFESEEAQRLIYEDTERFLDNDTSTTVPTKEHLVP